MKRHPYLLTLLALAAILTSSCKNTGKTPKVPKEPEITAEALAATKAALSQDVLASIDTLALDLVSQYENFGTPLHLKLTDDERYVQPEYLLDPAVVNNLVTKNQKANALAVLFVERMVRLEYGMPLTETEAAISKLAIDLNHPVNADELKNLSPHEVAKREYEICKERGDLSYFWMFNNGIYNELLYLMSQDPAVYLRDVTEEEWAAFQKVSSDRYQAISTLAQHDKDFARIQAVIDNYSLMTDDELRESAISLSRARKLYYANKDIFAQRRAEFLK